MPNHTPNIPMSLMLSFSNPPVEVKTWGDMHTDDRGQQIMDLGGFMSPVISIPMDDFVCMVEYVLTNADLSKDDPRIGLVERIKQMHQVEGHNPGGKVFRTVKSG